MRFRTAPPTKPTTRALSSVQAARPMPAPIATSFGSAAPDSEATIAPVVAPIAAPRVAMMIVTPNPARDPAAIAPHCAWDVGPGSIVAGSLRSPRETGVVESLFIARSFQQALREGDPAAGAALLTEEGAQRRRNAPADE